MSLLSPSVNVNEIDLSLTVSTASSSFDSATVSILMVSSEKYVIIFSSSNKLVKYSYSKEALCKLLHNTKYFFLF